MAKDSQSRIPYDRVRAVAWDEGRIKLIDQRLLPARLEYACLDHLQEAADAIQNMVVRGAPAIGITAAYAVVLGARDHYQADPEHWRTHLASDFDPLYAARPTAVNLSWAVDRMRALIDRVEGDPVAPLLEEAQRIHAEDIAANRCMGELGASLIKEDSAILTHCNTGALATGGYGTALGVVRSGVAAGRIRDVYANETRPWLQGARLTAWELLQEGIPVTITADSAAASLMQQGRIQWVVVGADRVAANGDVANKIGTYATALAAHHHGIGFMVVAPTSTVDMTAASGADIPIESRGEDEVLEFAGQRTAPDGTRAWNPSFDVTPAELIDAIVTEKGVVKRPKQGKLDSFFRR
ncbi:MAG: S-methyl-5-thioribose-1-phosphate isomerase [Acidiferrobacterales bacterium]